MSFLKKKEKSNKSRNFYSTIIRYSQNLREELETANRVICYEGMCKLDNLLNQLSLIFSSVLENQVNLCYRGRMPFLNMSDVFLEF